jgi:predicted nucleic acid-binding protein
MNGRFLLDTNIVIAKQHELTLVSRDDHFKEIENFLTLTW